MTYQVLARKWRPRTFAELVGQSHVVRPLVNALDHNRLHHAFLFAGTRGVGKTTLARILAKSLNCETGVSSTPCGKCSACVEVDEGRFIDLIEVDAASRTKVEDTRELLDNVQYAPSRGRYKVYLIDEVHMLSGHSFNALLKTLEEPPPHVKFLLATTDPQRLPVTVLSRCLQFSLKRLPVDEIAAQLEKILAAENVEHDAASVRLLARAADGSMRDGLSLLDQAIAFGGGRVAENDVRTMLGAIDQNVVERLLTGLAANDAAALLSVVAEIVDHGTDSASLLDELLLALHRLALIQTDPALVDESDAERLRAHAMALSPQDVQLYYQIGLLGRRDLPLAPDTRIGVEMALLRMLAFRPATAGEGTEPRIHNESMTSRETTAAQAGQAHVAAKGTHEATAAPSASERCSAWTRARTNGVTGESIVWPGETGRAVGRHCRAPPRERFGQGAVEQYGPGADRRLWHHARPGRGMREAVEQRTRDNVETSAGKPFRARTAVDGTDRRATDADAKSAENAQAKRSTAGGDYRHRQRPQRTCVARAVQRACKSRQCSPGGYRDGERERERAYLRR
jgi:DNA polymerase-3 subunit gamma/tau